MTDQPYGKPPDDWTGLVVAYRVRIYGPWSYAWVTTGGLTPGQTELYLAGRLDRLQQVLANGGYHCIPRHMMKAVYRGRR